MNPKGSIWVLPNIPTCALGAVLFVFWSIPTYGQPTAAETDLSRAADIAMRMSRSVVIAMLGPADMTILSTDGGEWSLEGSAALELYWLNGHCDPVSVMFDSRSAAVGWSEGRALCGDSPSEPYAWPVPGEKYSCDKADRSDFCR